MGELCCESDAVVVSDSSMSKAARRRRMKLMRYKTMPSSSTENMSANKRFKKMAAFVERDGDFPENGKDNRVDYLNLKLEYPKFGYASFCGTRRDMEDAVSLQPLFFTDAHFFAVFDGHGCSHVAVKCKERLHELVRNEMGRCEDWRLALQRSFVRMDAEVYVNSENSVTEENSKCRCELKLPHCNAVGSTAVVAIVTPDKIYVANCGDSRAILFRDHYACRLSYDHKPDRPDEFNRITAAGGRVVYWDGPRVQGILAMSRAIGDNYLKPFVSCEPEITVTDRTAADECLILATDGLWDMVSNETACGVSKMCLRGVPEHMQDVLAPLPQRQVIVDEEIEAMGGGEALDKACWNATTLLARLAVARNSGDNVSVVVVDLKKDM